MPPRTSNQFDLLKLLRFLPFFVTQSLGALNDNVFKNALVLLLTFHAASWTTLNTTTLANLAGAIFILPFFLFSATAGQVADKYDKAFLTRSVKLFEIGIMALAGVGFALQSFWLLMLTLFMLGTHSTLFGPIKYAILPQHLQPHELVGGNALVETGTSLAILFGTILGGLLVAGNGGAEWRIVLASLSIALAGYAASRLIPSAPPPAPKLVINWNPISETSRNLRFAYGNRPVFWVLLGISWFWFYGFMFLSQFPAYTKDVLGGGESVITLLLTVFSVGIAAGSLLCEKLSGPRIEIGLVPFGAIGLTLFSVDLFLASPSTPLAGAHNLAGFVACQGTLRLLIDLFLIGAFGGFYIVPLYALLQSRSEEQFRSRLIAANNILNALFMVTAAGLAVGLFALGLSAAQLFLVVGVLNALVVWALCRWIPEFFLRFVVWIIIHSMYKFRKTGLENIPEKGPAVLVCNHVSYADALIIMGACPRPIRFVMDHGIFSIPFLKTVFRAADVIPIASARSNRGVLLKAYEEIGYTLESGGLVAIFPEGGITYTGDLQPFQNGLTRVLKNDPVPVVPMALRGLWGSFFSRKTGGAMRRPFCRGMFNRIELVIGPAIAPEAATPTALQSAVAQLRGDLR